MTLYPIFKRLITTALCVSLPLTLAAQTITSPAHRVNFIELYTSQGCSSCPPAERWLNQFEHAHTLWTDIIPINFHVDYWDYLGWDDPYASEAFTLRQRWYRQLNHTRNVATPGFVVNGKGWNGWFFGNKLPLVSESAQASISATLNNSMATITIETSKTDKQPLLLHMAQLGFDLTTHVPRGENKGKRLIHDFVVLSHDFRQIEPEMRGDPINMRIADISGFNAPRTAVVIWISTLGDPSPIQAAADWLQPSR